MSIFKGVAEYDDLDDGKRSYVKGDSSIGYTFHLNTSHATYKFYNEMGVDTRKYYFQEQMLFQAYIIAIKNDVWDGPLADFKDRIVDSLSPAEAAIEIDALVGKALQTLS